MKRLLGTAAILAALGTPALAADEKIVVEFAYPYSHLFDVTYEKILPKFYEAHPNIEIKMRATYESYEDGTNTILR
ncbi:MAG: ABC transporter substrate-binding protein, partial [Pseudomonadota bacterium]